jgi:hypothetical protein
VWGIAGLISDTHSTVNAVGKSEQKRTFDELFHSPKTGRNKSLVGCAN